MLDEADRNLSSVAHPFAFAVVDAQAIPYPEDTFDAVIANHMLYHVPDRAKAIAEVRRVLKPDGRFYASTIGQGHFRQLGQFMSSTPPDAQDINQRFPFNLENGAAQLAVSFARVMLHRYEDTLVVTEAEPLLAYLASMSAFDAATDADQQHIAAIDQRIREALAADGAICINNDAGLFEAW